MIPILRFTIAACAVLSTTHAADTIWSDDLEASAKEAAAANKPLIVEFIGSDWCGFCRKLEKDVFSTAEFKEGVKGKYVFVQLDLPNDKSRISPENFQRNVLLKEKYAAEGMPTILFLDGAGKPFAHTGYAPVGPGEYLQHFESLSGLREMRDKAFAEAAKLEGIDKAKMLMHGLAMMNLSEVLLDRFYADEIGFIKSIDPKDETGFFRGMRQKKMIMDYQRDINSFIAKKKFKEAHGITDAMIETSGYKGVMLQQFVVIRGRLHAYEGNPDKALEVLEEARVIAPESQLCIEIDKLKEQIFAKKAGETTEKAVQ